MTLLFQTVGLLICPLLFQETDTLTFHNFSQVFLTIKPCDVLN